MSFSRRALAAPPPAYYVISETQAGNTVPKVTFFPRARSPRLRRLSRDAIEALIERLIDLLDAEDATDGDDEQDEDLEESDDGEISEIPEWRPWVAARQVASRRTRPRGGPG